MGVEPFLHDDPRDRSPKIFGGKVTLRAGGARGASVLIPVIPRRQIRQLSPPAVAGGREV